MSRGVAQRLVVLVALVLGLLQTGEASPAGPALHSGAYAVTVHDGGTVFQFTWTFRVSGGSLTGVSEAHGYGFIDPLKGSVSGSGATIVRSCGPQAQRRFKDCGDQTYTLRTDPSGNLTGTAVGFGILPGTTIVMHATAATISGTVTQSDCSTGTACKVKGLPGVAISASDSSGSTATATTGPKGAYSLDVEPGTWIVKPSLGDRVFDPLSTKVSAQPNATAAGVDFHTCAKQTTIKSVRGVTAAGGQRCPLLDLKVERVMVGKAAGWTVMAGKSYAAGTAVPAGFGEPGKDGDFKWACRSGCVNVRVKVTDAKTHRPVTDPVRIEVHAEFLGNSVDNADRNGTLCLAARPRLSFGCDGPDLEAQLNPKTGVLDLYYWVPPFVPNALSPIGSGSLKVVATSARYAYAAEEKVSFTVEPNVAFKQHTIDFTHANLNAINAIVPLLLVAKAVNAANYCGWLVTWTSFLASTVVGSNVPDLVKNFVSGVLQATKVVKNLCSLIDTVDVLGDLKKVAAWTTYWRFGSQLDLPPSGLIGPPNPVSFVAQVSLEYSQFFDAFVDAFKSFYLNKTSALALNEIGVDSGDNLSLRIYEASHRSATGTLHDALYLQFTGNKHGRLSMRAIDPIENYVEDGYFPGCWLNENLNRTLVVIDNPCRTAEEEPH